VNFITAACIFGRRVVAGCVPGAGAIACCCLLLRTTHVHRIEHDWPRTTTSRGDGGLVLPEAFEPIRSKSCVSHGRDDRSVAEIVLNSPRVLAIIGQLVTAGMCDSRRARAVL
jgi:hypothetical protein